MRPAQRLLVKDIAAAIFIAAGCGFLPTTPELFAQGTSGMPVFEAASMKQTDPSSADPRMMNCSGGPGTNDPLRFKCTNAPLGMLLAIAYDVQAYAEVGPAWMNTSGYEVAARVPSGATPDQMKAMLQNLLADRMHLQVRWDTRESRNFSLVAKNSKPLMKQSPTSPDAIGDRAMDTRMVDGHRRLIARRQKMTALAGYLSIQLGRPVSDDTDLPAEYDFTLDYWPEQNTGPNPDAIPGLLTAVQEQLGLKLEYKTVPMKFLVVDRADRVPTDN